ncbi:hypothetical protein Dhaf_4726 [Desulfitobacterium hafniense DCB-2]|uniref:Uncharacterized protein n=2 Tax=Desulfitobacterium hafniense TaxID=49338 RepID=G9XTK2_DESHA|nr:hypothetical protein Dhaf_4726 [Desulfitobacterium hafniense DCB-2]EHL05003.1 hypothetical protein HMPREF0322_04309 [Desulfitobacterium hafniense DP7]
MQNLMMVWHSPVFVCIVIEKKDFLSSAGAEETVEKRDLSP